MADLKWHYGPTATDPDPGGMWHYGCGKRVMWIDDGHICECGAQDGDPLRTPDVDNWYRWAPYVAALLTLKDGGTREALGWQMMKVAEEAGEVSEAWLGYVGQNPRKGRHCTIDHVVKELADVAATALVAIASLGRDPETMMREHVALMRGERDEAYRRAAGLD